MSDEKYDRLKRLINESDENGFNPEQQEEIRQFRQKWEESKDNTEWLDNIDMTD